MKLSSSKPYLFLFAVASLACCSKTSLVRPFEVKKEAAVIGGEPAQPKDFPYLVNIWQNSPADSFNDHLCGGSLIHPRWVLTAAHCVLEDVTDPKAGVIKVNTVTLFLGSLKMSGSGAQALKAKSIHIHPSFSWPRSDIALIELVNPVNDVPPVILSEKSPEPGTSAVVTGWGLVDEQGKVSPENLQKATLPLISRAVCSQDPYVQEKHWTIEADTLCAQTQSGQRASCAGDSGGPLIQKQNGQDVQVGVVSWGTACRVLYHGKQSDIEGYADVSAARPWINKLISQ